MNLKCNYCHKPFGIGRGIIEQSLTIMHEDDLVHFDFRCPKCKKATRVSKEQLFHAAPGWEYKPVKDSKKE